MTPQELEKVMDELKASRSSRKRAWENLQEIRWVLQDAGWYEATATGKEDDRFGR
jgi:hypothetical protein